MALLFDQYGNPVQPLDRVGGDTITDTRTQTVNLAASNAEAFVDIAGEHTAALNISGTFVGTMIAEASFDGSNYFQVPLWNPLTEVYVVSITTTAQNLQFDIPAGCKRVRLRMSAYTSGTAVVQMRATKALDFLYAKDIPATNIGTNTGASAAAVTLTIAAPGVGLYNYLVALQIVKFAAAALTAAAAPVLVTTTNITGSPVFSFQADAAAQGTKEEQKLEPSKPIKSATANTATTIVCPGTTGVIWRVNAVFYIGA